MKRLLFIVPLAVTALAGCATEPRQHPMFMTPEQEAAASNTKPELAPEALLAMTDDQLAMYLNIAPGDPERASKLELVRIMSRTAARSKDYYVPDLRGRGVPGSADGVSPGGVAPYPCSSPRPGERIVGQTQASNGVASVALCGT